MTDLSMWYLPYLTLPRNDCGTTENIICMLQTNAEQWFSNLASPDHLRRLCSAINMDTLSLKDSTIAYLTAMYSICVNG